MKGCWLAFAVLASLLLLATAFSEDATPRPVAPDVARSPPDHPPTGRSGLHKAWWKKWIQESRRMGQPNTPRPGFDTPLHRNISNTVQMPPRPGSYTPLSGKDPK